MANDRLTQRLQQAPSHARRHTATQEQPVDPASFGLQPLAAAAALRSLPLPLHPFVSSHRAAVGGGVRGSSASLVAVAAVGSGGGAGSSIPTDAAQRIAVQCRSSNAHSPPSPLCSPLQRTHPAAGVDDCSGSCRNNSVRVTHTHPTTQPAIRFDFSPPPPLRWRISRLRCNRCTTRP